ncbi:MAG TPA: hypothetical protein VH063_17000 [Gaiellaceae bacterium]|jgi:hypothetical protein|nr:hypothetical protein [Gaiellaceae bacterium]
MSVDARPSLAFVASPQEVPAIEIHVNFGIYAGRTVMLSEIDRLAAWLLDEVEAVTVVAEDRHEIGRRGEGSVHLVRVEVTGEHAPTEALERAGLEQKLLERVDYWMRLCIADRHGELGGVES